MNERNVVAQSRTVTEGFLAELDITIDASPETVFAFFTDPEKMKLWKGVEAELDPRPGGIYRVHVTREAIASGEYVRVDPPNEVVFTWGWEGDGQPVPPGSSTVTVTLTPTGAGTHLRLSHTGLPSQHMVDQHSDGWGHYLGRLQIAAAGGDPGRDPNLDMADPR
jgi:uncharacterized protein YndB with AHSA1/START domain